MDDLDEKTKTLLGLTGVIFLIFIIFSVALDPTQSRKDYAKCKSQAHKVYNSSLKHLPVGSELPSEIRQENQKKHSQADQKKLENFVLCSDLNAQWVMSFIGYLGLLAGFIGLFAIMSTLWQTMKAARAANDTLRIAKDTLTETKNTNRRQLRGYIFIPPPKIAHFIDKATPEILNIKLNFEAFNTGQTPTYRVHLEGKILAYSGIPTLSKYFTFPIEVFTQIHAGHSAVKEVETHVDISEITKDLKFVKGSQLTLVVAVKYHDIYSIETNSPRFMEVYSFGCELPIMQTTLDHRLIHETEKKTK